MAVKRLILVGLALLVLQAALSIARPMTSYRLLALGESSASVGWVAATFALAPLVLAVSLSRLASGRRTGQLAAAGGVLMVVGCLGSALMRNVTEAIAANVILGTGHLAIMLALQVLIARESPDDRYDRNFGYFTVGASVGQLVGPLVGTALLSGAADPLMGTKHALLAATAVAVLVVLLCLPLVSSPGLPTAPGAARNAFGSAGDVIRTPGALSAIYVGLVVVSSLDILTVYLPVLGEEMGIPPLMVGLLLSVRAAASSASRMVIQPVMQRVPRIVVLAGASAVAAVVTVLLTMTTHLPALVVLMVLLGMALGFGQPLTMSWVVLLAPVEVRGHALAVRLMGNRLGQVLVPAVAGGFSDLVGTRSVFWMLGSLLASSTCVAVRFRRQ